MGRLLSKWFVVGGERDLGLRGRPNNYLVHINFGRLLDRERNGAGDRRRRDRNLVHPIIDLRLTSEFVIESARFVLTNPGEMPVTRSLSPASRRKPSVMVRTAFFVAA